MQSLVTHTVVYFIHCVFYVILGCTGQVGPRLESFTSLHIYLYMYIPSLSTAAHAPALPTPFPNVVNFMHGRITQKNEKPASEGTVVDPTYFV